MPTMSKYKAKKRDDLGSRAGTIAAAVNKVMSTKWQTVEEIQKKTKRSASSVRRRLYHAASIGLYDYERIIRFKLKRKKK